MSAPIELDLDALVAAAEAAKEETDGKPWRLSRPFNVVTTSRPGVLVGSLDVASTSAENDARGAVLGEHIAAAQPSVVLELVRRLRAAEAMVAARVEQVSPDAAVIALIGDFVTEQIEVCREFHDAIHEQVNPDALVICMQAGYDISVMDEDAMRAAGWVRAEKTIPAPPPVKPEPKCRECGDDLCGGTGFIGGFACTGCPF